MTLLKVILLPIIDLTFKETGVPSNMSLELTFALVCCNDLLIAMFYQERTQASWPF